MKINILFIILFLFFLYSLAPLAISNKLIIVHALSIIIIQNKFFSIFPFNCFVDIFSNGIILDIRKLYFI